jgi:hypothetical protein
MPGNPTLERKVWAPSWVSSTTSPGDDPGELVLLGMRMLRRGLCARFDTGQVYVEILQADMIVQPAIPAPAVDGAESLQVVRGVAFGDVGRIEAASRGLDIAPRLAARASVHGDCSGGWG